MHSSEQKRPETPSSSFADAAMSTLFTGTVFTAPFYPLNLRDSERIVWSAIGFNLRIMNANIAVSLIINDLPRVFYTVM
jgi:hypothetical protein